jgi:hypothetical protein
MGNNKISQNENILVVVDQQNVVHVDPNTVLDQDGQLQSRLVDHENLVMYVNLEADLVPRSVLYSESEKSTLTSLASGTFNMMRNQGDKDEFQNNFDTNWTETFVPISSKQDAINAVVNAFAGTNLNRAKSYDPTAQTFGIESINIVVKGASNIPQVSINFIDVRGKTLFDSPENSPYKAFFHQPWPIFYLTVKGYYGKAIRYRIQLVDFKTRFNGNTGNFEISTKFVGSTYAFLNDILLQNIVNAPYMYMVESTEPYKTNPKTGFVEKKISKTTKGYSILKSVYSDYKAKGYIDKDFPVKTLRELLMTASGLESIIESTLFSETVNPNVLSDVAEYDKVLDNLEKRIISWGNRYLNSTDTVKEDGDVIYYALNKVTNDRTQTSNGAASADIITGTTNNLSLKSIIDKGIADLENNLAFGKKIENKKEIKTKTISLDSIRNIKDFYTTEGGKFGVANEKLIQRIKDIQNAFIKSRDNVEKAVEAKMNEVIRNNDNGFGFDPTIRNIFAVILANADTYIRLMQDVHRKAIQRSNFRKEAIVGEISNNKNEVIYPWPEVKKKGNKESYTHYYPADTEVIKTTQGNNFSLWPEVEFIETYNSVATKRVDAESGKEIFPSDLMFVFDGKDEKREVRNVSTLFKIGEKYPYTDKSLASIFYEIFERAQYITSYSNFIYDKGLDEICAKEFETLDSAIESDIDVREVLNQQVKSTQTLVNFMYSYSQRERYPYYQDRLPTVEYIKEFVDRDFDIVEYNNVVSGSTTDTTYTKLQAALDDYKIDPYRLKEFPFNSELYQSYLGNKVLNTNDYKFTNIFKVNQNDNFISSPINSESWILSAYTKNIFSQKITLSGQTRNLLNTPYFHKQLFNDFFKGGVSERYVGSAYILLNSLPYKDLDDVIEFDGNKVLMSSLFKEVAATHYVPYYLMLKWGAIYHRYKKYLKEGVDILSGVTVSINGSTFFDNGTNVPFNLSAVTPSMSAVTYSSNSYVGVYPYYHGIFHQIVNGYSFYNPSGFTKTSATAVNASSQYNSAVATGITKYILEKPTSKSGFTLTSLVDNSRFKATDNRYTILPSNGASKISNIVDSFPSLLQDSFRIILDDSDLTKHPTYNVLYFPGPDEMFKTTRNLFSLTGNKKKVIDLIATFSPKLLDEFESMFLEYSSLDLDVDSLKGSTHDYTSFQEILKEICSIEKTGINLAVDGAREKVIDAQKTKLEALTKSMLDNKNLRKLVIGNPKQIDDYIINGFVGNSKSYLPNKYDVSQLTTGSTIGGVYTPGTKDLIKLYIGQNITGTTYSGITNLYENFFQVSNIEVTEENIYSHRELARIYAGWVKDNKTKDNLFVPNYNEFKLYVKTNIFDPQDNRLSIFLQNFIKKFKNLAQEKKKEKITIYHGYNEAKTTKLDLYQYFKSFNDKWIAGNAIGQRHLMDEFLFLDRANRDIGKTSYISLERLISLGNERNAKIDLYSAISTLIQGTNFDMRPLPAYINFYGTNTSNKKRIIPSKNLARNLFGTFLDVDYQESSPKIILQYINKTSQYLDMSRVNKEYKFKSDSFDIKDTNNNPLIVEPRIFMETDTANSNRVVSFEVNFGDQAQGVFKSISLDQSTYKNTTESALAQERLARSQGGGGSHSVDIGLFDIYKTASYQCSVTCMGNVMLQPTMYFYLANVPMFNGTYLIFDVSHSIKAGQFETSFTGVRISNSSLPSLDSTFMSSYRPLFSRLLSSAVKKKQQTNPGVTTERTITTKDKQSFSIDPGSAVGNEDLSKIIVNQSGLLYDMIPYNGAKVGSGTEKYIQYIEPAKGEFWLRTRVVLFGGSKYDPTGELELVSGWKAYPNVIKKYTDIKDSLYDYYAVRMVLNNNKEEIFKYDTEFYNPSLRLTYKLTTDVNPSTGRFDGPVHNGPSITDSKASQYGIAMSAKLMKKLKLNEGDVVYFRLNIRK